MKRIEAVSDSDFTYINSYDSARERKSDVDFDVVKFKVNKRPHLDVDYFHQPTENLSQEDYDEYSFFEKAQIIINLYRRGHNKEADKLLEELTATTPEEKIQIKQLHKNKKLYKNQKSQMSS